MLKAIATVCIFTMVLVLTAHSATLENRDDVEYNYQITTNKQQAHGRIVSDAVTPPFTTSVTTPVDFVNMAAI
jgi:hypothetical protein